MIPEFSDAISTSYNAQTAADLWRTRFHINRLRGVAYLKWKNMGEATPTIHKLCHVAHMSTLPLCRDHIHQSGIIDVHKGVRDLFRFAQYDRNKWDSVCKEEQLATDEDWEAWIDEM